MQSHSKVFLRQSRGLLHLLAIDTVRRYTLTTVSACPQWTRCHVSVWCPFSPVQHCHFGQSGSHNCDRDVQHRQRCYGASGLHCVYRDVVCSYCASRKSVAHRFLAAQCASHIDRTHAHAHTHTRTVFRVLCSHAVQTKSNSMPSTPRNSIEQAPGEHALLLVWCRLCCR